MESKEKNLKSIVVVSMGGGNHHQVIRLPPNTTEYAR